MIRETSEFRPSFLNIIPDAGIHRRGDREASSSQPGRYRGALYRQHRKEGLSQNPVTQLRRPDETKG